MGYPDSMYSPWAHQREAMAFLKNRDKSACFADMGTGKTKISVDRLTDKGYKKTLVLCPRKAIRVWEQEFKKHSYLYNNDDLVLSASKEGNSIQQATNHYEILKNNDRTVIITNYAMLYQDPMWDFLSYVDFDHIILDESHRIKSNDSQASFKLFRLGRNCPDKLILTGTPMDKPHDIWAQFRFMDHKILGCSWSDFKQKYCVETGSGVRKKITSYKNLDELYEIINKNCYSISSDVLDLPDLVEIDKFAVMNKDAKKAYKDIDSKLSAVCRNSSDSAKNNAENKIRSLCMKARRLASGFKNDKLVFNHKMELLEETIEEIPDKDNIIIFAYFHNEMDKIKECLNKKGFICGEISGREDDREGFESGELDALVVQIQAGSEALNCLTRARWGIFFAPTYSYLQYAQARKRLHRPGQKNTVRLIRLITENSIEEKMIRIIQEKLSLAAYLLDK